MPELVCAASDRGAWLAARRTGVTATDIVAILGLSPYDSQYSLYWRKLGQVPEVENTRRWIIGRRNEPGAIEDWAAEHPDSRMAWPTGLFRSSARPWQMATPDALADPGLSAPLEIKTWADAARDQWQDGPPPAVRAQVLWQMDVMDAATGHVGVLFLPSGEFRSYVVEHAPVPHTGILTSECPVCLDIDLMRESGEVFWRRVLGELPPPDPDASAATLAAVRARFAPRQHKRATVDGTAWEAWDYARDCLKYWEGKARGYEIQLREQLGEADEIEVGGVLVGRRVVVDAQVKAHTRHQDYIRRITPKGEADDQQ